LGAFGENLAEEDPDSNLINYSFPLRFPGQYRDSESGLHYNYFRDYEPGTGRYVESDPIGLLGGISTYGYVGGQALTQTDRFGLCWSNADALAHFMFGLGRDVSMEQIGCSSQLGAATAPHRAIWKGMVGAAARARAGSMRCGSFSRLNMARSVGASSGIFWIGGFSLSQRGNCVVQRHCGSNAGNMCRPDSFSFECLLTSRMNDLFVNPSDFDNSGGDFWDQWNYGGTPFNVSGYWGETISGGGPL